MVSPSLLLELVTDEGAVMLNESVDGDPKPFPSQLVAEHPDPLPVVPDEGVNVQLQPRYVPVFEVQLVELTPWGQTT